MHKIEAMTVVGVGQMGAGIAQVAAGKGLKVAMMDVNRTVAERAKVQIEKGLRARVAKGKVSAEECDKILANIDVTDDDARLAASDIVIEAVTENASVKCDIFRRLGAVAERAILATNTSAIPITKLAATITHPERVIGMHFMNPAPVMRLVELVRGLQTSAETLQAASDLARRLDKEIIVANDMPGFIVNRMLIPFLNEACFALQEGLGSPQDIDAGAKLGLNHPMGPLELADLIGLDTVLYMAEVLHREFGDDKYRPPTILRNHVSAGWLGRKTGRGFYRYDQK